MYFVGGGGGGENAIGRDYNNIYSRCKNILKGRTRGSPYNVSLNKKIKTGMGYVQYRIYKKTAFIEQKKRE